MDDRPSLSARDYVESLHQNSRATLLYGKNNVLVQPVSTCWDIWVQDCAMGHASALGSRKWCCLLLMSSRLLSAAHSLLTFIS